MKKINYSNFEMLEDVIKAMDFNYSDESAKTKEILSECWEKTIGEKISKLSKVYDYSTDNMLTVICSDSFVANELYFKKDTIVSIMNKKIEETGIEIKDIKFDYKKWKEKNE